MMNTRAPTDQRAGVRPIAFVLQNGGSFGSPVTMKVRPEDLSRTEPSRINVTQTLGRDISGWVDGFGPSLPSVNISGHTGWRTSAASGKDGVQAFEELHNVVMPAYHKAKQAAIDAGTDPATVKLLFVDMLDNFTWNVAPMQFVLRRSRSRPLLMQYNIQLQAVSTNIENPLTILPFFGSVSGGLTALSGILGTLQSMSKDVQDWVSRALVVKDQILAPIAKTVKGFYDVTQQVFNITYGAVSSVQNGISSTANSLILIAKDLALAGVNIFRTISSIAGLPSHLKAAIGRVASAFNEVVCIFSNSLRPRGYIEDYTGLYGASNCSSTTGGRGPSAYANMNAFNLMQTDSGPVGISNNGYASMISLGRMDPVMAPMSFQEIDRNAANINAGLKVTQ